MPDKTVTLCARCGRTKDSEVHSSSYGQPCLYTANRSEAIADKLFSWCTYGTKEYAQWSATLRDDIEKAGHELKRQSDEIERLRKENADLFKSLVGLRKYRFALEGIETDDEGVPVEFKP
jgi:hypothetical protein